MREGAPPKSLDSDKNYNPYHTLFYHDLRTFWKTLGKISAFLGSNTVFIWQEIAYSSELNLQICNYAQKRLFCRAWRNSCGLFGARQKADNFRHPSGTFSWIGFLSYLSGWVLTNILAQHSKVLAPAMCGMNCRMAKVRDVITIILQGALLLCCWNSMTKRTNES